MQVEAERDKVFLVLEVRELAVSAQQRERIERCSDLGELRAWTKAARTVAATEELFRPDHRA